MSSKKERRILEKLISENESKEKSISEENIENYTNIVCYLSGSGISSYDLEFIRKDVIDKIVSSQERGEKLDEVMGSDLKKFCDTLIEEVPKKSKKQKVIDVLDLIFMSLPILILGNIAFSKKTYEIIRGLIMGDKVNLLIPISFGVVISTVLVILVSYVIVNIIIKNAFVDSEEYKNKIKLYIIVTFILCILLPVVVGNIVIFNINIFLALFIAVVFIFGHKLIKKY